MHLHVIKLQITLLCPQKKKNLVVVSSQAQTDEELCRLKFDVDSLITATQR